MLKEIKAVKTRKGTKIDVGDKEVLPPAPFVDNDKIQEGGLKEMLYTVKETAERLNCNETVLMAKLAKGEIKGKKQLGRWLISEENILEYTQGIKEPITIKEFAKEVRKCEKCIRDNVRNGKLKGAKIGGKWYVDKREIEKFY